MIEGNKDQPHQQAWWWVRNQPSIKKEPSAKESGMALPLYLRSRTTKSLALGGSGHDRRRQSHP